MRRITSLLVTFIMILSSLSLSLRVEAAPENKKSEKNSDALKVTSSIKKKSHKDNLSQKLKKRIAALESKQTEKHPAVLELEQLKSKRVAALEQIILILLASGTTQEGEEDSEEEKKEPPLSSEASRMYI